jgi:hypothetical protein
MSPTGFRECLWGQRGITGLVIQFFSHVSVLAYERPAVRANENQQAFLTS